MTVTVPSPASEVTKRSADTRSLVRQQAVAQLIEQPSGAVNEAIDPRDDAGSMLEHFAPLRERLVGAAQAGP